MQTTKSCVTPSLFAFLISPFLKAFRNVINPRKGKELLKIKLLYELCKIYIIVQTTACMVLPFSHSHHSHHYRQQHLILVGKIITTALICKYILIPSLGGSVVRGKNDSINKSIDKSKKKNDFAKNLITI